MSFLYLSHPTLPMIHSCDSHLPSLGYIKNADTAPPELANLEERNDVLVHLPVGKHGWSSGSNPLASYGGHCRRIRCFHLKSCSPGRVSTPHCWMHGLCFADFGSYARETAGVHSVDHHLLFHHCLVISSEKLQRTLGRSYSARAWKWRL